MESIELLHPFSAQAIGLREEDLLYSHSKPHEKAIIQLKDEGYVVGISYFTGCFFPYKLTSNGIQKKFWPITIPLLKKRHIWRRQYSHWQYMSYKFNVPDLTIINMSGHGSRYVFDLAKLIKRRGKSYIAMIGGIHMANHKKAISYYKNAHHIIVHTEAQKKKLQKTLSLNEKDIMVVPLGVDTDIFCPSDTTSKKHELLYVGRISRLKQIELCLETLAYVKKSGINDLSLRIIGPVSDVEYYRELKSITEALDIAKSVVFMGPIEQSGLLPYYQNADLLMLPSKHESFGMVMVEAMACGTPVAALEGAGGPDEVVIDGLNGLLCTKENIKDRILDYFLSPDLKVVMEKGCRASVEKNWNIFVTIENIKNSVNHVFK